MGIGCPDDNMCSIGNSPYIFDDRVTKTVGGDVAKEKKTIMLYFSKHFCQLLTYIVCNYNLVHDGFVVLMMQS